MTKLVLAVAVAVMVLAWDAAAFAQQLRPFSGGQGRMQGPGSNVGSVGGSGTQPTRRSRRPQRRNQTPALSQSLNLLGAAGTFEGQYLLRQVPQEEAQRAYRNIDRSIQGLQQQIYRDEQLNLQSGLGSTGHKAAFFSYGQYYNFSTKR